MHSYIWVDGLEDYIHDTCLLRESSCFTDSSFPVVTLHQVDEAKNSLYSSTFHSSDCSLDSNCIVHGKGAGLGSYLEMEVILMSYLQR